VQTALGCDRRVALRWVAEEFGLDVDCERSLTAKERWQYTRARTEAERFGSWCDDKIDSMRRGRNHHFQAYHRALRIILQRSLNHPEAGTWADACEAHERYYQILDEQIHAFLASSIENRILAFRREKRVA
jgi:hypothetical protein